MSLLISIICAITYFAIAELIHKKITGRYFEFGYGTQDKHDIMITMVVVITALASAPFLVDWIHQLTA